MRRSEPVAPAIPSWLVSLLSISPPVRVTTVSLDSASPDFLASQDPPTAINPEIPDTTRLSKQETLVFRIVGLLTRQTARGAMTSGIAPMTRSIFQGKRRILTVRAQQIRAATEQISGGIGAFASFADQDDDAERAILMRALR